MVRYLQENCREQFDIVRHIVYLSKFTTNPQAREFCPL